MAEDEDEDEEDTFEDFFKLTTNKEVNQCSTLCEILGNNLAGYSPQIQGTAIAFMVSNLVTGFHPQAVRPPILAALGKLILKCLRTMENDPPKEGDFAEEDSTATAKDTADMMRQLKEAFK